MFELIEPATFDKTSWDEQCAKLITGDTASNNQLRTALYEAMWWQDRQDAQTPEGKLRDSIALCHMLARLGAHILKAAINNGLTVDKLKAADDE